jgi:hypothetical protein
MPAQPLGDRGDQLVAEMVAERVVDVLEMIEVDAEDGGGRAAPLHVGNHPLQALAEIRAVGQARQCVVQGEMPELILVGGDPLRRAAHVAQREAGEEGEPDERNHDEGDDALDDLRGTQLRGPGETGCGAARIVGEREDVVVGGERAGVDPVQVGQVEASADFRQHALVEEFHRQGKRRVCGRGEAPLREGDERRRNDGGAVGEGPHAAVAPRGQARREDLIRCGASIRRAAADEIDERIEIPPDHGEPGRSRRAAVGGRIDEPVGAIDDEDIVVLEVAPQHQGHVAVDPFGGGRAEDVGLRLIGRGEAFQLAQHPFAAVGNGVEEQLFVMRERDFIGAPGRRDDGDHQAQNRSGHDQAHRNQGADAGSIPHGARSHRCDPHSAPPKLPSHPAF